MDFSVLLVILWSIDSSLFLTLHSYPSTYFLKLIFLFILCVLKFHSDMLSDRPIFIECSRQSMVPFKTEIFVVQFWESSCIISFMVLSLLLYSGSFFWNVRYLEIRSPNLNYKSPYLFICYVLPHVFFSPYFFIFIILMSCWFLL